MRVVSPEPAVERFDFRDVSQGHARLVDKVYHGDNGRFYASSSKNGLVIYTNHRIAPYHVGLLEYTIGFVEALKYLGKITDTEFNTHMNHYFAVMDESNNKFNKLAAQDLVDNCSTLGIKLTKAQQKKLNNYLQ